MSAKFFKSLIAASLICSTMLSSPAMAYYSTNYHTEAIIIGPSESAFWVPDAGDNKNSQQAFDSEDYLNSKKIPSKMFIVPHHKLGNSGGYWGVDAYVPDGRLYIVDRSPVTREWLADPNKGTNKQNEGFACQSSEGHNITVGVAISTNVLPENAAKFMYNYGVHQPDGQQEDPNVIFTSVWWGRSLSEVMDTKIRSKIGIMVCEELMSHPLLDDNRLAKDYMVQIRKDIEAYLISKGITLDFIGWADTWTFDKDIQDSLNRRFAAVQDKEVASMLGPYATTITQLAAADALRTKWNGVTPSSVALTFIPQSIMDTIGSFFKNAKNVEPLKSQ